MKTGTVQRIYSQVPYTGMDGVSTRGGQKCKKKGYLVGEYSSRKDKSSRAKENNATIKIRTEIIVITVWGTRG